MKVNSSSFANKTTAITFVAQQWKLLIVIMVTTAYMDFYMDVSLLYIHEFKMSVRWKSA